MLGLNVSRDGAVTVDQLRSVLPHGGWVRIVLTGWHDLREHIRTLQLADFRVLGVVARESFDSLGVPVEDPMAAAAHYASRYDGVVTCVQVGNEFDHESESSETLPVPVLNRRLAAFAARFNVSPIILGGAVSGNPAALRGIQLNLVDAACVHPYGQRPEPSWPHAGWGFGYYADLMDAYASELDQLGHGGMPIWITEVGLSTREVTEAFRADYLSRFCRSWEAIRKTPLILFCGHDYAGFGIIGTPSGDAVRKVAEALPAPPQPVPTPHPPSEAPMLPENVRIAIWRAHVPDAAWNRDFGIERAWSADPYRFGPALSKFELTGPDGLNYRPFAFAAIRWHPTNGAEVFGAKAA